MSLRAEREGACLEGRVYSLVIDATDNCGKVDDSDPFTIAVPHSEAGPSCSANPESNQPDSRPGWNNGTYGSGCK